MLRACFAALLTLAGPPLQDPIAQADPIAEFYNGRVVSLIIASGEGGYDAYGRLHETTPRLLNALLARSSGSSEATKAPATSI